MKLSYTALKTFQECRFRFSLRYHRGLSSRPRPPMRLSRALHGALKLFHEDLRQRRDGREDTDLIPAPLDSLLAHFTHYYDNHTRPLTESQHREGKKLLTRYWETHQGKIPTPYLLEEPFSLHVGPFLLTGHFDRVDEILDGYELIDYKLSQRSPLPPDPLQLDVYQLGFHAKTGQVAKKLSFYWGSKGACSIPLVKGGVNAPPAKPSEASLLPAAGAEGDGRARESGGGPGPGAGPVPGHGPGAGVSPA